MLRWKEAGFLRGRDEGLHLARGWAEKALSPGSPPRGAAAWPVFRSSCPLRRGGGGVACGERMEVASPSFGCEREAGGWSRSIPVLVGRNGSGCGQDVPRQSVSEYGW